MCSKKIARAAIVLQFVFVIFRERGCSPKSKIEAKSMVLVVPARILHETPVRVARAHISFKPLQTMPLENSRAK